MWVTTKNRMRLTQHGRLASSTLLFEPGNNNAPNDGKEPDNDKHQSHWRHDEREARSYHHKPAANGFIARRRSGCVVSWV